MDGQNFNNGYNQQQQQQPYGQPQQPYGQPQQPYGQPYNPYGAPYGQPGMPEPNKPSGLSIAGLVIGIITIVSSCVLNWISGLIGLVSLILSIVGQAKNKSSLGLAAIIVSAVGMVLGILFFIFYAYIITTTGELFGYSIYR